MTISEIRESHMMELIVIKTSHDIEVTNGNEV